MRGVLLDPRLERMGDEPVLRALRTGHAYVDDAGTVRPVACEVDGYGWARPVDADRPDAGSRRIARLLRHLNEAELVRALREGRAHVRGGLVVPAVAGAAAAGRQAYRVRAENGSSAIALSGSTAKTIASVIAAATIPPALTEIGVGFDGVTATNTPVLVDLCLSTQATTGTSTAFTPLQVRGVTGGPACTAAVNYTAEPTVLSSWAPILVDPNKGLYVLQMPLGRETHPAVLSAGTGTKALPIRCNAPSAVNVRGWLEFEE